MMHPGQSGAPILVLGIGNILNTDEGIGVHAARALQARYPQPEGFTIADGGTLGLNLLPLVDDATHLLILDAVDAGREAGTIITLGGAEIPLFGGAKLSEHQISFQEVLGLAMLRGTLPLRLHLVGMQPADLSIGVGLSQVGERALPQMIAAAEGVLHTWGLHSALSRSDVAMPMNST